MNPIPALRWFVSYAAFVGAGVCLWQAQAFWDQQSQSLRSSPDAWMEMLRHHLVVVDAGHGGTDGGTQGFGVLEKKCSLAPGYGLGARSDRYQSKERGAKKESPHRST